MVLGPGSGTDYRNLIARIGHADVYRAKWLRRMSPCRSTRSGNPIIACSGNCTLSSRARSAGGHSGPSVDRHLLLAHLSLARPVLPDQGAQRCRAASPPASAGGRLVARGADCYETPEEAVLALLRHEQIPPMVWEPFCGPGAIARILRAQGGTPATDLVNYASPDQDAHGRDFLLEQQAPYGCDAIVTNPPFKLAGEFVEHPPLGPARRDAVAPGVPRERAAVRDSRGRPARPGAGVPEPPADDAPARLAGLADGRNGIAFGWSSGTPNTMATPRSAGSHGNVRHDRRAPRPRRVAPSIWRLSLLAGLVGFWAARSRGSSPRGGRHDRARARP